MQNFFKVARDQKASDVHLTAGLPIIYRIDGDLKMLDDETIGNPQILQIIERSLTPKEYQHFLAGNDIDSAITFGGHRYRLNCYRQRENYAMAIRVLNDRIPSIEELGLPNILKELCSRKRGLILVVGPTGSGKSTTLASMLDHINRHKRCHILTLEDPIEYMHTSNAAMVNQREVGKDVESFARGLKSALREDPDVILVGELRDYESISLAISAAETGHLVFATLHTSGATQTIDRIIDVFPPNQQNQVRSQLSTSLQAVISQSLLPKRNEGGRIACVEVMLKNDAISNMIREGKTYQIMSVMQTSIKEGMMPFDTELMRLYKAGIISIDTLKETCQDPTSIQKAIKGLGMDITY